MADERDATIESTEKGQLDETEEAALEDLIDELGAEPEVSKAASGADPSGLDNKLAPTDVLPDSKPDLLDNQSDGAGLPETEHPDSAVTGPVDLGDASIDGPSSSALDPADLDIEADPTLDSGLQDILETDHGTGGLDGRNPAADGSGGESPGFETDPNDPSGTPQLDTSNLANPYAGSGFGDGSAAGKLPPHQQEHLNNLREMTDAANAAGDSDRVDELNKEVEEYVNNPDGAAPDGDSVGTDGGTADAGPEGSSDSEGEVGMSGSLPVGYKEGEGVVVGEGGKELAKDFEGTWAEALSDWLTGTSDKTERGKMFVEIENELKEQSNTPEDTTKDQGEDFGLGAPDRHAAFTNEVFETQAEADAGADIDPNPNDDTGTASTDVVPTDVEEYTADYGNGYVPIDEDEAEERAASYDITPDEEFLET